MRCLEVTGSEASPGVRLGTAPEPEAGARQALIEVLAAGVIPTELRWYPTWHAKAGEPRRNAIPGHEFSGVITALGSDTNGLKIGDEVFGMNDWYADGAMADCCVAPVSALALKPTRLTAAEAASVPISALTAWQALFDHAHLRAGERVLIHGAAGGVGTFAVQLAKLHGAYVIATASSRNLDFVSKLGAHEVIDYRTNRFEEKVNAVDVVLDTVGGDTLDRSWGVLSPQGRLVTVASSAENSSDARVKNAFFIVEPDGTQLSRIAALLQDGSLAPVVDSVVPLSQAPDVYSGKLKRQGRGKIVVSVTSEKAKVSDAGLKRAARSYGAG